VFSDEAMPACGSVNAGVPICILRQVKAVKNTNFTAKNKVSFSQVYYSLNYQRNQKLVLILVSPDKPELIPHNNLIFSRIKKVRKLRQEVRIHINCALLKVSR